MIFAHISDLHFFRFPHWTGVFTKRLIGLANLYIRGRRHHFHPDISRAAIASVLADQPDAVLISGDLTALASPSEFEIAREALEPLIERIPTVLVPGNHDYYTRRATSSNRIEDYFADILHSPGSLETEPVAYPTLHLFAEAAVIGMNPNIYSPAAIGRIKEEELAKLPAMLEQAEVKDLCKIVMLHYPLFNRGGTFTRKFWRRLGNREKLLEILRRYKVDMLLHGHDHSRYINFFPFAGAEKAEAGDGTFMFNSGSAGYMRPGVSASYNLYRIENRRLVEVTVKEYRGPGFYPVFQGPPSAVPCSIAR